MGSDARAKRKLSASLFGTFGPNNGINTCSSVCTSNGAALFVSADAVGNN